MSVLKNKHMVIAMLVAPILAVLAYYAMDSLVGEKPMPAEQGQSYPLVEKPNCRYNSGKCGAVNADFELNLVANDRGPDQMELVLESAYALDGVMVSLVRNENDAAPPAAMRSSSGDGRHWSLVLDRPEPETDRLRLVASAQGSLYYGDVATRFTRSDSIDDPGQ
jgi:hypothetical protein